MRNTIAHKYMSVIIRRHRDRVGISQQHLADIMGVSKTYISMFELGDRIPNLNVLLRIADALNVSAAQMVKEMCEEYNKFR